MVPGSRVDLTPRNTLNLTSRYIIDYWWPFGKSQKLGPSSPIGFFVPSNLRAGGCPKPVYSGAFSDSNYPEFRIMNHN